MQKQLLWKCLTLFVLGILLLIPLGMIENTIIERSAYREEAIRKIAANSAGTQTLIGPLIVIPVEEIFDEEKIVGEGDTRHTTTIRKSRTHQVVVYPKRLALDGNLATERRAYGLHSVAVFELQGQLTGSFDPPAEMDFPRSGSNSVAKWGKARLVVGLSDSRGIVSEPRITLATQDIQPQLGTGMDKLKNGFQAAIPFAVQGLGKPLPFKIELRLSGTESLGVIPVADQTTASLHSNWSAPSFTGGFLPRMRTVDDKGFRAQWSVSALAANVQQEVLKSPVTADGTPVSGSVQDMNSFRVKLIDPVDIYRQAVRAIKYAILFIVLTFAAFFLFESIKSLAIHPIQYGLVGLAMALFFLLLVSLSEHIDFAWAYCTATAASVSLIVVYLAAVLGGWLRAFGFGAGLSLLFAALFGVLQSEQNALLLGSLLLFSVLASLMVATRRIDWYRLKAVTA